MRIALVKTDVAAADLGRPVAHVLNLADGGMPDEPALIWVFDLAATSNGMIRSLRFYRPEIESRAAGNSARYANFTLPEILATLLPTNRAWFHAGQIDELLQIRPPTRHKLNQSGLLVGRKTSSGRIYARQAIAEWLASRWLGKAQKP